jgi:hypothetical protein
MAADSRYIARIEDELRISLIAAAFIALPLLAACGSDHHVTQADVSKALQDSGLKDPKLADCAAKIYVGEGISQDGLRLMTKPGSNTQATDPNSLGLSKDDADKARTATQKIVSDCLK